MNSHNFIQSEVGKYSITSPKDAQLISDTIKSLFPDKDNKKIIITDATANNGGNTLNFAINFYKVNAVEIDKKECIILEQNIKNFKIRNIKVFNQDYLNIMNSLKQDIIFLDPPWGGPNYKKYKKIKLFLGKEKETNVINIINKIKEKAKMIVLKVPFNFDFSHFFKLNTSSDYFIRRLMKYFVIFILT